MKKMKYAIMLLSAVALLWSCSGNEETVEGDYNLSAAVAVTPEDNISIDLDNYADTLRITWSPASWDGPGWPTYSVAFDTEEGDFSRPVAVFYAPQLEVTGIALTKTELKEIYNKIAAGEKIKTLSVKWKVRTAAFKTAKSDEPHTIVLSMTPDPDAFKAGNDIFIAGEGAVEAGRKMIYIPNTTYSWDKSISAHYNDNAPRCKEFDYEIFTELKGGAPFYFWSGESTGDKDWIFVFDNNSASDAVNYSLSILREATFNCTVATDGVYRIRINSAAKEVYVKQVTSVSLRHWKPVADNTMSYAGNGVWTIDLEIPAGRLGYKFLFNGLDGDQPTGAQYPSEAKPDVTDLSQLNPADKYWHMVPVQGGAANGNKENGTFLFLDAAVGTTCRYTVYMNDTYGTYTHCVSAIE
ncbi:MAG: SusE domain-containing protein [Candidatus Cryptobacteroides sp.]